MSEKNTWNNLRKKMIPQFWAEATRHEDKYQRGIADVSFVQSRVFKAPSGEEFRYRLHGWMELKHVSAAPARPTTVVKIPHYSTDQRIWLRDKGEAGGMTFLFLQIDRDFLLFDHERCQEVGLVNRATLTQLCNWESNGGLDARGLWEAINEFG